MKNPSINEIINDDNKVVSLIDSGYDLINYGFGWFLRRNDIYDDLEVFNYSVPTCYDVEKETVLRLIEKNKLFVTEIHNNCFWAKIKNTK